MIHSRMLSINGFCTVEAGVSGVCFDTAASRPEERCFQGRKELEDQLYKITVLGWCSVARVLRRYREVPGIVRQFFAFAKG